MFNENFKHIFYTLIGVCCVGFAFYFFFSANIAGGKGIYGGIGKTMEELEITEVSDTIDIDIEEVEERVAPSIKYIYGAQEVGAVVQFKALFAVQTEHGEKNGALEDGFTLYLSDICDATGESVIEKLSAEDINNLEEIPSAIIYDEESDLLYFHKSGVYVVHVLVYGTNGASARYQFSIPVEIT